ncbi:unnamed protein product [Echinostoma caproni]|uniref:DUF211 domain-containing protein n=1 Tax=Echinostoma caproni TaxID=27848 RepID=A0A183A9I4_9TREM|nr:unnamed protein product [Echinostoma caproni]
MRRLVIQCRYDEDIPKLMEIIKEFGAIVLKPEKPERFDHIHVDVPEETEKQVEDFQKKVMETIPLVAVKRF